MRMKATRVFQLTALALVVVSAVQVGWWLYDQHVYTLERVRLARRAYAEQTAAAQALLEAGTSVARVHELLPKIAVTAGRAALDPTIEATLITEARHRSNQYAWEGSFFLLALGVCIAVIARALRAEARVLEEQDSFLALVSHQFKTPLASLQLSLETMALRELSPERARTLIERMLADLARMEAMVTQILESVRLERGRADLKSEPLELRAAVTRVVAAARGARSPGAHRDQQRHSPGSVRAHRSAGARCRRAQPSRERVRRGHTRRRRAHRARRSRRRTARSSSRCGTVASASGPPTARGCSRSSRACIRAAAAATTAPGSGCSSCGG